MSYIRKLPNGKYRAEISKNYTSIQSKTFSTERKAEEWAESIEQNIAHILSIKPSHIEKVLAKYAAGKIKGYGSSKPKSNNTLLRTKSVLSSIFQYGMDKNYLDKNPSTKVRIKAVPNQIERFLCDDERV